MPLHIVYATDARYLWPTGVAAGSAVVCASHPNDIVIDIFDCGVPDELWNRFELTLRRNLGSEFGLVRHKMDMRDYDAFKSWHTSKGIYARLEIPRILSTDVDWCIYADGDTLFTADPFTVFDMRRDEYALMGHVDGSSNIQKDWFEANGYNWDPNNYVCAGFLLINLTWFRQNNGVEKCFEMLRKHPDIPYNDQDVLNIVCFGRVGRLSDEWGVFTYDFTEKTLPGCFHYVARRPWEGPIDGGYIRRPFTYRLWDNVAAKVLGYRLWHFREWGIVRYGSILIADFIMETAFKIANKLPIGRGRYDKFLSVVIGCGRENFRFDK